MMRGTGFVLDSVGVSFGGHSGVNALSSADLEIHPGEAVGVVGPSGAGKTTLLRLLVGWIRPTVGEVRVDGRALDRHTRADLRRHRSQTGFVHQDHALVPNLRVSSNVLAGRLGRMGPLAGLRHVYLPSRRALSDVHAHLERVGIPDKLFARTDTLSGGEQQRVALARALYQGPRAVLADEPVASVDPARARAIIELLLAICREDGLTLVVSVHNMDLAREFLPRLIGLRSGRVVFDGPPSDLDAAAEAALFSLEEG